MAGMHRSTRDPRPNLVRPSCQVQLGPLAVEVGDGSADLPLAAEDAVQSRKRPPGQVGRRQRPGRTRPKRATVMAAPSRVVVISVAAARSG